jgi:hypothetical protein
MRRALFVLVAFLLQATLLFAQEPSPGGVKGRVLSKTDRSPVEYARVFLYNDASLLAEVRTDAKGNFLIDGVEGGSYVLVFRATGYLENRLAVAVPEGRTKNVFNILLAEVDKAADSWEDNPLGSTDIQRNIINYIQKDMQGEPHLMDVDLTIAGVMMDGFAMPDITPFAEALRENAYTSGAGLSETAFGGFNGTSEVTGTASLFRTGFNSALTADTYRYGLRADASYATGVMKNGWAVAADVSGRFWRQTETQAYTAYVGVDKHFSSAHQVSGAFFMIDNPMSFLRYDYTPSARFKVYVTALGRFSELGSLHLASGFTWRPSSKVTVAGGVDTWKGIGARREGSQALAWSNLLLSLGKWGVNAGFRAGYWWESNGGGALFSAKAGFSRILSDYLRVYANGGYFRLRAGDEFASSDVNLELNTNGINVKLTGFYETPLGTDNYHAGMDLGFKLPLYVIPNVSLQGSVIAGRFGAGTRFAAYQAYGGLSWNFKAWFVDGGYLYAAPYNMVDISAGKTWTFQKQRQWGIAAGCRPFFGHETLPNRFSFRVFCRL